MCEVMDIFSHVKEVYFGLEFWKLEKCWHLQDF